MAKKQKRKTTRSVDASQGASAPASQGPAFRINRPVISAEFNPDYSYVVSDLKRIGILAVSFFVILVALSFFLK